MLRRTNMVRRMAAAAGALIITCLTAVASAQEDYQPWTLRDDPKVSSADLERFIEDHALGGTDAAAVLRALYDDLLESYRIDAEQKAAEQEERNARVREWYAANPRTPGSGPPTAPPFGDESLRSDSERRAQRRQIEQEFSDVVVALLDDAKADAWRSMARGIDRRDALAELQMMQGGGQSRPYLDLVRVTEAADLAPEDAAIIAPVLDRYDLEMAAAIDALVAIEPEMFRVLIEHNASKREPDAPGSKARLERLTEVATRVNNLRTAVKDVNVRFLAEMEMALPESARGRFARAVRAEMHPLIYAIDPVEIAVERLLELDWITAAQRETIEHIWAEYEPAREAILDRIVEATRRWESPAGEDDRVAFQRARLENRQRMEERVSYDELEPEPLLPYMYEPLKDRYALAVRTARLLRAVFDPVDAERLPLGVRLALGWADASSN